MNVYTIDIAVSGKSFLQAQEQIKTLVKTGYEGDIEVLVEPGKYFFEAPLILTPEDCGVGHITYRADLRTPEDEVILTGAKPLVDLDWEDDLQNPNIKVAQIEKGLEIDGLVVNGTPQILCRYPNFVEGAIPLGSATDAQTLKVRVKSYDKVETGYIRALHDYRWGGNSYKILGKDDHTATGLQLEWVGDNNRGSRFDESALVIENIREELDVPGEWYYDRDTGKLYFYPIEGMQLETAQCEIVVASEIVRVVGEQDGKKVKHITFEGFKLAHTKRTLFTTHETDKAYVPLLRGDWCVVRSGAIYIQDAEQLTFRNLTLEHIGGNGIFISGYNRGHVIEGNTLRHMGASGIQVVGLPEAVHQPSFWAHDHYPELKVHQSVIDHPELTGPRTEDYPLEITLRHNHIWDVGIFEKQSSGINLSVSRRCRLLHNTIHQSPRSCININDGTFGGHEVAYNDIFDAQKETMDHGPFNSWGRDRFWSVPCYNASGLYGDQIKAYSLLDAIETTTIHDNRFHHGADQPHTWGIDLDDGSSNYEIYNNLCLGMGVKLREGFRRRVHNNIFVDGSINIHCTYAQAEDEIQRNIVIGSKNWEFAGQDGGDEKRVVAGCYVIDHNGYFCEGEQIHLPDFFEAQGYDAHGIKDVAPVFRDRDANDYTVTNEALLAHTGFKNFDMMQFGQKGCPVGSPIYKSIPRGKREVIGCEWQGAVITTIDDGIISSTASYGYEGVYFKEVPPTSRAYALGFRARDLVKHMASQSVNDPTHFLEMIGTGQQIRPCEVEIFRDTQWISFKIS